MLYLRIHMNFSFLDHIANCLCSLADRILYLALCLLNDTFNLQRFVASQFASLALGLSHHFVNSALHLCFIQIFTCGFNWFV